jgi:hypothetical protein
MPLADRRGSDDMGALDALLPDRWVQAHPEHLEDLLR